MCIRPIDRDRIAHPSAAIDLWVGDLDRLREFTHSQPLHCLDRSEEARAAAFPRPLDASRFVVGRSLLRLLLADYLGTRAAEIPLSYGRNGKPFIPGSELMFNVAHADNQLAIAVGRVPRLGVDVEAIRRGPEVLQLADRFFSRAEVAGLASLPEAQRSRAAVRCWTRKEAVVKALARGLSQRLDSFTVSLSDPPRVISLEDSREQAAQWHLASFCPADGYVGTLAWCSAATVDVHRYDLATHVPTPA